MAASCEFHERHGSLIFLSNGNRTARRRNPSAEFNNGLVFTKHMLGPSELLEVRIDRKITNWSGSMAIGVTTANPSMIEIPSSATGLKNGYWIMSGMSVVKNGTAILDSYGTDLDELTEGDRVGVLRTGDGCLHFYVNGKDLGVAASEIPGNLYGVVDLYGKCVEVSVYSHFKPREGMVPSPVQSTASVVFHPHCGSLVQLGNRNRTAERQFPEEEFKNSVVLTNQPLRDNELFEVVVEKLTDMWAGSLEVGITSHNPLQIVLPPTMTSMTSGAWMWSGTSIIINGQEVRSDYSELSLESIKAGDKVGILKTADGTVSFYLNGVCMGVAADDIPPGVFGVVDLYGAAVRVSVVSADTSNELENEEEQATALVGATCDTEDDSPDDAPLLFSSRCGKSVRLMNGNYTAFRPRALEEFNNAVVLTNRPIKHGELFEVYVDRQLDKWAGSLEIGLTTHNPATLELPATITNLMTGAWVMSGGGMMKNGVTTIETYGRNLDDLKAGDRVGLVYKEDGSLNFFINGEDMGLAAQDIPVVTPVYGMVDLYGRSAQATITNGRPREDIPEGEPAVTSTGTSTRSETPLPHAPASTAAVPNDNWFTFSSFHGDQVVISHDHRNAIRVNPLVEFNNAIVMSQRPLRDDEMFEIIIEKQVDRWSGSLEAGVTSIAPDKLSFPNTITDLDHDTWMLSGSSVLQDGATILNGYGCDLDKLKENFRLGIMRKADGSLHYFVNGEDCGSAASSVPAGVYAIIDLYGQCVQVSVYDEDYVEQQKLPSSHPSQEESRALSVPPTVPPVRTDTPDVIPGGVPHGFHPCCGKNVSLENSRWTATRCRDFSNALLFSAKPLHDDEIFEIKVDRLSSQWSGSLGIGVTSCLLPMFNVPATASELRDGTWIMVESRILKDGVTLKENYGWSLDRTQVGASIGVQRRSDGTLHIYYNGEDQGVAAVDVPRMVFAVVDLYGKVEQVSVVRDSDTRVTATPRSNSEGEQQQKGQQLQAEKDSDEAETTPKTRFLFSRHCGQHVRLDNRRVSARRVASYNYGVVLSDVPLLHNALFQIRVTKLESHWSGSLMVGLTDHDPECLNLPSTANSMKICPWIVVNKAVYINGNKVFEGLGRGLDDLRVGDTVGLMIDTSARLHVFVNGEDQGVVAEDLPAKPHMVVDLYGSCQEVSIVTTVEQGQRGGEVASEEKLARGTAEERSKSTCEYRQMCDRFRQSLAIPDGYFNHESKANICYCQTCRVSRSEKEYEVSGDPQRRYALPLGWCQFALGLPPRVQSLQVLEKWHVAFYGTQTGSIRRILDTGDLLIPDSRRRRQSSKKNFNKENETPQLMISPSVKCAICSSTQNLTRFRDGPTGTLCNAQVAFLVRVKPGSYCTGQSSCCDLSSNEAVSDHNLDTPDLEWYIKEKGTVLLAALLIKIDPT
ncbi:neuralized-like protein 4 isoform X1 [Nematostella vectensis]|uniref:neuralized-like protein 4 isoform X1 n=1 Tax=Nematostella vectensis TaxID=45351 RepID=UPI00207783C8|nr:neuralized-like protein 4 isoform X1 [Nematostella vectensis]